MLQYSKVPLRFLIFFLSDYQYIDLDLSQNDAPITITPPEVAKFKLEKGPTYLHSPLH